MSLVVLSEVDNSPNDRFLDESLKARFYGMKSSPEVRVVLESSIRAGKLSATESMVAYLKKLYSEDDLYAASICIREGADVNVYVISDEGIIGSVHLLCYMYSIKEKVLDKLFNLAILTLLASGSSAIKPAFVQSSIDSRSYLPPKAESVIEWLSSKGLDDFIRKVYPDMKSSLDGETLRLVGILASRVDFIKLPLTESDAITVVRSRANAKLYNTSLGKVFDLTDSFPPPDDDIDYKVLIEAVFNYNRPASLHYISRGNNLSYPLANVLLLEMISYATVPTIRHIIGWIFVDAVEKGLKLDYDQQTLISASGKDFFEHVMKVHSTPYWRKHCSNSVEYLNIIPEALISAAQSLGFTGDKNQLCKFFSNIFLSEPKELIRSLANRQRARIGSKYGYIGEFQTVTPPILAISNSVVDPYDYVDNYIVFYRDGDQKTWAWTSDHFQFLLKSKVNPSTNKSLPDQILKEVREKVAAINDLKKPLKWEDVIDRIIKPDSIDNDMSEAKISCMIDDLVKHNVPSDLVLAMSAEELSTVISPVSHYSIGDLTQSHALTTFSYIYCYYKTHSPVATNLIISSLINLLNDKMDRVNAWSSVPTVDNAIGYSSASYTSASPPTTFSPASYNALSPVTVEQQTISPQSYPANVIQSPRIERNNY